EEPGGRRPCTVYLSWDRDHNIAYISMKHETVAREAARQVSADRVVLDFGGGGELLGVELSDAETLMPADIRLYASWASMTSPPCSNAQAPSAQIGSSRLH